MDIKSQFNLIAEEYDKNRRKFIPCFDDYYINTTRFIVSNIETPKRILDLGAGTGLLSYFWYQHYPKSEYVLVDIADDMLNVARKRFAGIDNVTYQVLDYTSGLPNVDFDVIASALSIHHLENKDKMRLFAQIYEKLPSGGLFVNYDQFCADQTEMNNWFNSYWENQLANSGLTDNDIALWKERKKLDKECSVEKEIEMISKCGFRTVKCVYFYQKFAVIVAIKQSLHIEGHKERGDLMHDIWNPWHGCVKCSEGCQHCYMFFLDKQRDRDGADIYRTSNFDYPVQMTRKGGYKVQSGELIRVCMTSDFFLEEADAWRDEAWDLIRERSDVKFFLLTKRPQRVKDCLPDDWGDGWENVMFNVTCENQRRADERIPILLDLPFKHKGIMCAPFIGAVSIEKFLGDGQIEQVICGGENYDGARPCSFEWVKRLRAECVAHDITFCFIETGTVFIKDGRRYNLPSKRVQSEMAHKSGMNYQGKPIEWKLTDRFGVDIPKEDLYVPHYRHNCETCGSRLICNGCSDCGKCE